VIETKSEKHPSLTLAKQANHEGIKNQVGLDLLSNTKWQKPVSRWFKRSVGSNYFAA
jgi:hypothetical protein